MISPLSLDCLDFDREKSFVLLVCANHKKLTKIVKAMTTRGVAVLSAESTEEAWAIACRWPINAVVLDEFFWFEAAEFERWFPVLRLGQADQGEDLGDLSFLLV